MNILQHEAHKRFSNPVATVDPFPLASFTVTTLDPANVDADKNILYSRVDPQVVAEIYKNILTEAEYSKLMIKINMFNFQDDTTGKKIIDGPCLLNLLFDHINPNIVL